MSFNYVYPKDAAQHPVPGYAYEAVSPAETGLRQTPSLLLGPVPAQFGEWFWGDQEAPEVGLHTIDDVTLRGDRLLTRDGNFLCIEQNGIHPATITEAEPRAPMGDITDVDEPVVLLCGPAFQMYGHWLVDFMPRLHVLTRLGIALDSVTYLLPHNLMPFSREWLKLLGIPEHRIRSYDVGLGRYRLRQAIIPTGFRGDGRANRLLADAMVDYKQRILGTSSAEAGDRRLFVSRNKWRNDTRTFTGIDKVEAALAAEGFEIVYPETLSIRDQVALFSQARVLIGEYGSGLHNSIFSGSGATVISFRGTTGHPGFLQSGLCAALDQNAGYVFCETVTTEYGQGLSASDDDVRLLCSLCGKL